MTTENTMVLGGNGSYSGSTNVSFDNLYPAILECFVIVLGGYAAGRMGLISGTQSKGIGTFVSKFCLPALLFKSMCELNFSQVNWTFLWTILIAKTLVFLLVLVVTLVAKRPLNVGYAGLFAIFCTQSNDFALGYPILEALYKTDHPEYLQYIYLVAPISLVFLNPIGFLLMEIQLKRSDSSLSTGRLVLHVVKGVILNPIVFMTAIGIVGNFAFKQQVPMILSDILMTLGNAFSATALFYLGLSLVGKVKSQTGIALLVPILLIFAKTLLLPLITWEVIGWLDMKSTCNESEQLSMYGFLYGTFPTAPSVFLYASQYGIAQDIIASGMVIGTFLSAPVMFVSAKMMTVVVSSESEYKHILDTTNFDTGIISLVACVWVLGVLVLSGRWRRVPHRFTMCFLVSEIVACIGLLLGSSSLVSNAGVKYLQVLLLMIGVFSGRCWTAMIAVAVCLLHVRGQCFLLRMQIWLALFGFGFPVFVVGILFIADHNDIIDTNSAFHLGRAQSISAICVLVVCVTISVLALVIRQRNDRLFVVDSKDSITKQKKQADTTAKTTISKDEEGNEGTTFTDINYQACNGNATGQSEDTTHLLQLERDKSDSEGETSDPTSPLLSLTKTKKRHKGKDKNRTVSNGKKPGASVTDLEDIAHWLESERNDTYTSSETQVDERTCLIDNCSKREKCRVRLQNFVKAVGLPDDDTEKGEPKTSVRMLVEEYQTGHHLVLLLLLLFSMFVGIFLCVWRLFNTHPTGIYIEVEFLDGVFNYGQGFLCFAVFGFDTKLMFAPLLRRYISRYHWINVVYIRIRRLIYGVEIVNLPSKSELSEETISVCQQFEEYHKDHCEKDIVRDLRYRLRRYSDVVIGSEFCDWLIKAGLCRDREECVAYGQNLLKGRVLGHVTGEHNFHDLPYFYKFLDSDEYAEC